MMREGRAHSCERACVRVRACVSQSCLRVVDKHADGSWQVHASVAR